MDCEKKQRGDSRRATNLALLRLERCVDQERARVAGLEDELARVGACLDLLPFLPLTLLRDLWLLKGRRDCITYDTVIRET